MERGWGVGAGGRDGEWPRDDPARRYDAVFLALGQDVGRRLDAEGAQARGVIGALEFLRETGLRRPVKTGKNVLVIGGGNTACDAARSAVRLGGGGSGGGRPPPAHPKPPAPAPASIGA